MKIDLGSHRRWMAPAAVALLASLSTLPAFARDGGRDHHDRDSRGRTNVQVLVPDIFSGRMMRGTRPEYRDQYYNDQYYSTPDRQRYHDRDDYEWDHHDRDRWDRDRDRHARDRRDRDRRDRDRRDRDDHRGDRW